MGRGSSSQRELSEQQLGIQNKLVNTQLAERAEGRRLLLPKATQLMNSEGYSGDEQNAMLGGSLESLDIGGDVGSQEVSRSSARRGNSAGVFSALAAMNADRARAKSDVRRSTTQSFADEKQRRQTLGLQTLASMYGIDTNLVGNVAGLPIGALNARAQGIGKWSGPLGFGGG